MSQSLLDLPWDWQSCCSPTWGNPGAPPNHPGHILSVVCKQQLIALTGAGGFSLSGKPQEMVNVDPTTAAASLQGASPQPGWGHKPASISAALGSPPAPFSSLQLVVGAGPSASPGASPRQPHMLSLLLLRAPFPGDSIPPCGGNISSRSLYFPFRTAWRALGVQPHTGSSSEEGAGVPGWHQGTLVPLPRCPRRCLCEHGQPLSFLLLSSG